MTSPSLLSVNVGLPRSVPSRGRSVRTGIFKEPVLFRVHVGRLNLDGDRQADHECTAAATSRPAYDLSGYSYWRKLFHATCPSGSSART